MVTRRVEVVVRLVGRLELMVVAMGLRGVFYFLFGSCYLHDAPIRVRLLYVYFQGICAAGTRDASLHVSSTR